MKSSTRSPNTNNENLNNAYFSNYISSTPQLYSEASLQENNLTNQSQCICSCHCHENKNHKFHRDSSCNNLSSKKYKDSNIISISDNNATTEKKSLIKYKSQHNMIPYPNDKLYLFQQLKKNYKPNYNYSTVNNYTNLTNNTSYKNSYYIPSNNRKLKNHSFVDIKEVNNNSRKDDEIKYYRVQAKRKQLSKFYHNIGLKKYPYGNGKIQTSNKTNNHKYTEIYGTSSPNNKNINNKRSLRLDYELNIDGKNYNINNINNIKEDEKYNNHRCSFSNDFDRNKNIQIKSAGKNDSEVESKIIKETYNTRLIEVKSPSKEKNYNYKSNYNLNDSRKNLFNSYQRRTEFNNLNNNNSRYNEYKSNNINISKKYNNVYTNKPKLNISEENELSNNNCKHRFTKYHHIPYAFSLGNRITEQNNMCCNNNINNEKKNNLLRNNRINNINYKILKQKVRLSLLKKQIYEQKRNMLYNNNKGYYNPNLIINDNLCEKTRQLIDNDNCTDRLNNYNYQENF